MEDGTCQCCRTALHVDRDGDVYVAWRHIFGGNVRAIALARSVDGGRSFSPPTRVHADGWAIEGCPHNGPSITVAPDATVHVTWYTAADGRIGLYHAISKNEGRSFERPERFMEDVPNATVRIASSGEETLLAWEDPRDDRLYVGSGDRTVGSFAGSAPAVAMGANLASVAWQQSGAVFGLVLQD